MSEIKTLADQLRRKMGKPDPPANEKKTKPAEVVQILELLRAFDIAGNKSLVHARFDGQTAQMLHHFKMATGIEVTRLICYSVKMLFDQHPELKTVIKEHLEKFEL